ncbi:Replicase polyprotein 1a, partial [Frankliniella fusca]
MAVQMHKTLLLEAVLVAAVLVCCAHAIERPKLPRGGAMGEVVSAASDAAYPMEGLVMRLSPRQGRSPYWPLRHPALENARKRQRTMESFQPPQVRFFNSFADFGAGAGGPYVDDLGPPPSALDEPKAIMDNRIRDRPLSKAMTAEDLIRALQEKALRQQSEEEGLAAGAIRFGGMLGRNNTLQRLFRRVAMDVVIEEQKGEDGHDDEVAEDDEVEEEEDDDDDEVEEEDDDEVKEEDDDDDEVKEEDDDDDEVKEEDDDDDEVKEEDDDDDEVKEEDDDDDEVKEEEDDDDEVEEEEDDDEVEEEDEGEQEQEALGVQMEAWRRAGSC